MDRDVETNHMILGLSWLPVVKDAGVAGDAGYTPQNTAIYTLSMLACVVLFQALFRSWNLPSDERMTLAHDRLGVSCSSASGLGRRRLFLILEGCVVHLSDHPSPLGSMVGGHCVIESSSRSSI